MNTTQTIFGESIHENPLLISIVTCTYNSAKHLEKTLRSVEEQRYPAIEHILNDSYCKDGEPSKEK